MTAPVPVQSSYGDESSEVLPNGTVLTPDQLTTSTYIYNPATNQWTDGPKRLNGDSGKEENWVKMPNGEIMSVPAVAGLLTPQVFVPGATQAKDAWVATANLPAILANPPKPYDVAEMGPGFLLPDGRVWQIGGNNLTALYTLPSKTSPKGSWAAGPSIPQPLAGKTLTGADVPGAMLPNGEVLFTASPLLAAPTYFYLFNPTANNGRGAITAISPPGANTSPGESLSIPGWYTYFLDLPNGQILYDQRYTGQLWLYTPAGTPSNAWRPAVLSVKSLSAGTYLLTGTQLNGISEGASYGDDAEMSTNYPIVTLTAKNGTVYYARTYDWSDTSVQTGQARVTTRLSLPSKLPVGTYALRMSANGITSEAYTFRS